ncbi:hypothetical protein LCGC14_1111630 [marine sediment metagenome]|uniref:Uncharacterized protein n=1 Tax=marine sediment metagenome TaxID=412755 RepID=A0A0F9M6F9_9ZZZZ
MIELETRAWLQRLEGLLTQILIQSIDSETPNKYIVEILQRAGLTKPQALRALDWEG